MGHPVTKGKLNRMLKYFKNKPVSISYEYNNSLCMHHVREHNGYYDAFEIEIFNYSNATMFTVKLFKKEKRIFEQEFSEWAEFTGLGAIEECNSGPFNYFSIKILKGIKGLLIRREINN